MGLESWRTLWACLGAGLIAVLLPSGVLAAPTIEIVEENPNFHLLAVDGNGVAYGRSLTSNTRLYRSTDEGQNWTEIHRFPDLVRSISVTSKNTLFAHIWGDTFDLWRSDDGGTTWDKVFTFPAEYRSLTPHSLTDVTTSAGHFLFIGSYNAHPAADHMNWLWRSADDGRTWSVAYEASFMRHFHFVQADPYTGFVYAGTGDTAAQTAILRSTDAGLNWLPVCSKTFDCKSVDTAFDPAGDLVFGQDVFPPDQPIARIERFDPDTAGVTVLADLPGPSYSALALDGVNYLIGHTHEPGLVDDGKVHLFASDDGAQTFTDAFSRAYTSPTSFTTLLAQFQFPNGHFPIQIERGGTIIARLVSSAEAAGEPTVSIGDVSAEEGSGAATFSVTLSKAPTETVTLRYRTADGSAVSGGLDYAGEAGSLIFNPAGPLTQEVAVRLTADATDEDDETLALVLTELENAGAADGKGVATILDDDPEPVISATGSGIEDDTASVAVNLDEASGRPVLVDYATGSGTAEDTDYEPTEGTLTFLPGQTSKSFELETLEDARDEDNETVRVLLSNPVDAMLDPTEALVTVVDDDLPPVLAVSGDDPMTEGQTATYEIALDAPSERAISVTYKANGVSDTVDFAPLETTTTVDVESEDDELDEPDWQLILELVGATNATIVPAEKSGSTTVLDNDEAPEISIEDASVAEGTVGTSTLSFRLTLSAPSGWTVVVPYTTTDGSAQAPGDFAGGGGQVTIPPGNEEGFIEINVNPDSLREGDETMGVELGMVEHAEVGDGEAIGTIHNTDPPPPPPQVADVTAPILTVVVLQRGLQTALRRGVPLRISSSEATNLLVKLRLRPRLARRLGLPRLVGTEALALGPVKTAVLSARFTRRARSKLATLDSFRLVVEVTGTDRSGNVAVWRSRIVLTRG